jgi:hypothetical protein
MDRCAECGFVYADHGKGTVVGELRSLDGRYAARLRSGAGDAAQSAALRRPRRPSEWSALEYGCHIRDVLLAQRERLFLTLVENRPSFAPIYRDQRAALARYSEEQPEQVAIEIGVAAGLIARAFAGCDSAAWDRTCIYNFPEPAEHSVEWLAQHTLHEGEHHLADIDRSLAGGLGVDQPPPQ